jgi:hypothetical protein
MNASPLYLLAVNGVAVAGFTTEPNAYQGKALLNRAFVGKPATVVSDGATVTVAALLYNPKHTDLLAHVHDLRVSNQLTADPVMADPITADSKAA